MYKNGIIIQSKRPYKFFKLDFQYVGLSAFTEFPLSQVSIENTGNYDQECRKISDEVYSKRLPDGMYMTLEFISSFDLFSRYIQLCKRHDIPVRALFVESDYEYERWVGPELEMRFLGYELSPIPIDYTIIGDLQFSKEPKLKEFKLLLNENGLFDTFEQVSSFKTQYMKLLDDDKVGDGEMDAFICKVSEIYMDDESFI